MMADLAPQEASVGTETTDILKSLLKYSILLVASAYVAGFIYTLALLTSHPQITTPWTNAFLPREAFSVGALLIGLYVMAVAPIWFASYPHFPYPNWFSAFTTVLYIIAVIAINWKSDADAVFKPLPLVPIAVVWTVLWGQSDSGKGWRFYRILLWIAVGLIYFSLTMGCVGTHRRQNTSEVIRDGSIIRSYEWTKTG